MNWINVKEKLPDPYVGSIYSKTVLAIDIDDGYPFLAVYTKKFNMWLEHDEAPDGEITCITHWMPLPELPNMGQINGMG